MRVYILLFNARTENEGIHTIQLGDRNIVLMFESSEDAERYALMLEAQDFPSPKVEEIDQDEVIEFCQDAGYEVQLIEEGTLAMPPETNVEKTDWNPEEKTAKPEKTESAGMSQDELDYLRSKLEGLL